MHLRAPSPEVQYRDSAYRLRPADRARERHSRDSERSPNVETGAASVGRLQALMDAKRDAEFEAEISLFEDHNADIPEPTLSAQITQLFRWRNQAIAQVCAFCSPIRNRRYHNQSPQRLRVSHSLRGPDHRPSRSFSRFSAAARRRVARAISPAATCFNLITEKGLKAKNHFVVRTGQCLSGPPSSRKMAQNVGVDRATAAPQVGSKWVRRNCAIRVITNPSKGRYSS